MRYCPTEKALRQHKSVGTSLHTVKEAREGFCGGTDDEIRFFYEKINAIKINATLVSETFQQKKNKQKLKQIFLCNFEKPFGPKTFKICFVMHMRMSTVYAAP